MLLVYKTARMAGLVSLHYYNEQRISQLTVKLSDYVGGFCYVVKLGDLHSIVGGESVIAVWVKP
jgi:hypothetical protein